MKGWTEISRKGGKDEGPRFKYKYSGQRMPRILRLPSMCRSPTVEAEFVVMTGWYVKALSLLVLRPITVLSSTIALAPSYFFVRNACDLSFVASFTFTGSGACKYRVTLSLTLLLVSIRSFAYIFPRASWQATDFLPWRVAGKKLDSRPFLVALRCTRMVAFTCTCTSGST